MTRKTLAVLLGAVGMIAAFTGGAAWGAGSFVDVDPNSTHANNIESIRTAGITLGCTDTTHYCPADFVRRDQMAAFLARGLGLSTGGTRNFPVANARGQVPAYCAVQNASPYSFNGVACKNVVVPVPGSGFSFGGDKSLAIGIDGFPVATFWNSSQNDLMFAHCTNAACTHADVRALDTVNASGTHNVVAIGSDGFPIIAFSDTNNMDLKVIHCQDASCSVVDPTVIVASTGDVGSFPDIAINALGIPVISHYDSGNGNLEFVHCGNVACTSATANTVDFDGNVGQYSSIALGSDGKPIISYYDTGGRLLTAHCNDLLCANSDRFTIDVLREGLVGSYSSIAIAPNGFPVISYYDEEATALKLARCNDLICDSVTLSTLDSTGDVGRYTSLAIGFNGWPAISYYDDTNDALKYLRCNNAACDAPAITTVDSGPNIGFEGSLGIGHDGVPVIAWTGSGGRDLRVGRPALS